MNEENKKALRRIIDNAKEYIRFGSDFEKEIKLMENLLDDEDKKKVKVKKNKAEKKYTFEFTLNEIEVMMLAMTYGTKDDLWFPDDMECTEIANDIFWNRFQKLHEKETENEKN